MPSNPSPSQNPDVRQVPPERPVHPEVQARMDAAMLSRLSVLIERYSPGSDILAFAANKGRTENVQVRLLLLAVTLAIVVNSRPSFRHSSRRLVDEMFESADTHETRATHRARRLLTRLLVKGIKKRGEL